MAVGLVLAFALGALLARGQPPVRWKATPQGLVQWKRGRRPKRHPWSAFTAYCTHADMPTGPGAARRLDHIAGDMEAQFGTLFFLRPRARFRYPLYVETTADVSNEVGAIIAAKLPRNVWAAQTPLIWIITIAIIFAILLVVFLVTMGAYW